MVFPFARHGSERGYGHPDGFPVELELKTERLGSGIDQYPLTPSSVRNLSKTAYPDAPASLPEKGKFPSPRSLPHFGEAGSEMFWRKMCAIF